MAKKDIYQNKIQVHYNVSIKTVPSYQVLTLRRVVSDYYAEGYLWKEMSAFTSKKRLTISDQTFSIYHDPDYREANVDIEICAPVAQMGKDTDGFIYRQTEPIELMASTMVYGSFENIAAVYLSFANWLEDHPQYRLGFPSRQIVHRGPWNKEKVEDHLTEIQIPLEEI